MAVIHNNAELLNALINITAEAMTQVSKDIADNDSIEPEENVGFLQKMLWEKIYTYDYYPNKMYYNNSRVATFQFYRAFKWKKIEQKFEGGMFVMQRELFYDWQSMKFDPETFLHASATGEDMREQLADVLNVSGEAGMKSREPFWDITIENLFDLGALKTLFDMALADYT